MSADQRPNNASSNQAPTNHNNNNTTNTTNSNNQNTNNNNSNAAMNHATGIPVGMHGMQSGMAAAGMQAGVQTGMQGAMQAAGMAGAMQAGMAGAMQPGMAAGLQANMSSGIRSPVSQVQLIHSPLPGPPYHFSQFPYNPQLMLQNAAVQAAMQAQMSQQLNLAMQGRPPSVGPKSPSLPVLSPSPSSTQAPMSMPGTTTSSPSSTMSTAGGNGKSGKVGANGNHGNQAHVAAMMGGKATMIPRQPTAQPIVIGQIGVVPGQPVSTAGFLPQGCDPSQLVNSPAGQLRLTNQQQLVTSTGQIITSQPMLTNQAVLQAMASLQQQGIPIAPQPLLNAQTGGLIPSQPLFIRPAGPMAQAQQNMMANVAANSQAVNNMKNQKPLEAPSTPQSKAPNNTPAKTQSSAQPRNLTILPSTSRPGLNTARVYPTSMPSQTQATKLNIPQVTPKLSKIKSRAQNTKSPAVSAASQSKTTTSAVVKPTTTTTTTTSAVVNPSSRTPSKSQSESESEASKKASPSTPPAGSVLLPAADQPKSKPTTNSLSTAATTTTTPSEEKKAGEGAAPAKDVPPTCTTAAVRVEERMEVDKAPSGKKEVVMEKQRAIVKPHILTHVIEGFVIQEGPEPFPVERSSLLTDFIPPKHDNHNDAKDSEDDQSPYAFRDPTPDEMLGQGDNGSVSMPAGRCMRKRKPSGLRMRRGWRAGRGGRMSLSSQPLEDNSSSRSEHESSSSVGSPSPPQELEMETDEPNTQGAPNKWTVQEVFDFIASITGCATYAEEFRAQEIDGQALMLLKEDHLMTTMNMKLGPALKICARINSLKDDYV